ncbi:MAG TPA: penicillin-binding protein 2 [Actinomycetota bacterium]|nr:penicillin-binding protein 2 [Actinomycetota bacterium]
MGARVRRRLRVLATLLVLLFSALATRLWFLQVLASPRYARLAEANAVKLVALPPPRGEILDRHGRVLASTRTSIVVTVTRQEIRGREREVLGRLARVLGVPARVLRQRLRDPRLYPYQPVPVARDVPLSTYLYLGEHRDRFPGVDVQVEAVRDYPLGELAAHVIGYVGEVSAGELASDQFRGYRPGDLVGKAGVERTYERWLQGRRGYRQLLVDAQGRLLDPDFGYLPPTRGHDLVLSIDARIQRLAARALREGILAARGQVHRASGQPLRATSGAVVVMDPRDGRVLAMASFPSFDPSVFVSGELTRDEYRRLTSPEAGDPLLNRAIAGTWPPGSTVKPLVALAALKEGIASLDGRYACPAAWSLGGHVWNNWAPYHFGWLTIAESIVISCDTVYYPWGYQFYLLYDRTGKELMQRDLRRMGLGRRTGIDLPGETAGVVGDQRYKERLFKSNPGYFGTDYRWYPGDNVNMSIGQGMIEITPVQLAVAFSAIANGGTVWSPRVAWKVLAPDGRVVKVVHPRRLGRLPLPRKAIAYVRNAMAQVPVRGTAAGAFAGFPLDRIPVGGKTGTADVPGRQPTSWFGAFAPANDPRYVVVAVVEEGGFGAQTAAPVVRRVLEGIFRLPQAGALSGSLAD